MLIPSVLNALRLCKASLSRRVNANSQLHEITIGDCLKLIKKGEC